MAALSALRSELYLKLRDSDNRTLSNAQANTLLNNALQEWVSITEEIRQENAIDVVAQQFDYAAPTDIIRLHSAFWMPTRTELEVVSRQEFQNIGGYRLNGSGTPKLVVMDGIPGAYRLRLWPAPSATSEADQLDGAINSSVTTITLDSTSDFRSPAGWVKVNSEKVLYQNLSSTQLLLCRRAVGNTTAASHSDNDAVTQLDLHFTYSRRPATLSADADAPEIDARYQKELVTHALAEALRVQGRTAEADRAMASFREAARAARFSIRRMQGAAPSYLLNELWP